MESLLIGKLMPEDKLRQFMIDRAEMGVAQHETAKSNGDSFDSERFISSLDEPRIKKYSKKGLYPDYLFGS